MPTVYPPQPATISGDLITVNRLINYPTLIQRALRTLVQQRLIGDRLLTGRVDLTGTGAVNYEQSEAIMANNLAERVGPLGEYPTTTDGTAVSAIASTEKWALAMEISDELVARNRIDLVNRRMVKLANRIAFGFDALILSAIASQVTQTSAAVAAWSTTSADPFQDIAVAATIPDSLNQGYEVDTIVADPIHWARLISAAKVIERAPREGSDTLLVTGRLAVIAGLTVLKTTNLPSGVTVMALDSRVLGSVGYEDLGGGYVGSPDEVQSKRFRLDNEDGWRVQARRVGVPLVQEPGAAVKITGA